MKKEEFNRYPRHWVTSDIHFSHINILKYNNERLTGSGSVDEMNERIVENWNSVVSPDDHIFILGDVAMGKIILAPPLIKRLNGDKTLIAGNHDRTLRRLEGIHDLFLSIRDYRCMTAYGVGIVMSHFPMASWEGMGNGAVHLHGHLHGNAVQIIDADKKRIKDVGMDTNNLFPYDLKTLVEEIKKKPMPIFDHHNRKKES